MTPNNSDYPIFSRVSSCIKKTLDVSLGIILFGIGTR